MNKKLLKTTIKEFLPIFIIITIILISFAISGGNLQSYHVYANNSNNYVNSPYNLSVSNTIGIYLYLVPTFLVAIIIPFFAMNYRYNLAKADFYMSLPLKEKELKRYRVLTMLVILLIAFTLSFIVFFITARSAYLSDIGKYANDDRYHLFNYNFIYFILVFFILLAALTAHYFISAALFNQSNSSKQSFNIVFATLLIPFIFAPTISLILSIYENNALGIYSVDYSPILLSPTFLTDKLLSSLSIGHNFVLCKTAFQDSLIWTSISLLGLGGIGCGYYVLGVKDPSGEYSGKIEFRNKFPVVVIHVLFALIFALIAASFTFSRTYVVQAIILSILSIVGYYIVFATTLRSFKISKINLIIMLSLVGLFIILIIFFRFTSPLYINYR